MSKYRRDPSLLYRPKPLGGSTPLQWAPPPEEKKLSHRMFWLLAKVSLWVFLLMTVFGGAVGYTFYVKYSKDLPDIESLRYYKPSLVTRIFDTNDTLAAEYYVERRILLPLNSIPLILRKTTIAVEDSSFYQHFGLNIEGIIRAAWANYRAGRVVQGGSSITQQVAKALLLSSERTYVRKIREAILSIRIDRAYTKDEILEIYLNHIYYGEGAYGVEAAALTYFGKSVNELNVPEVAMIVGMPKAPSTNSPHRNMGKTVSRRGHVLNRMMDTNIITKAQMEEAVASPIRLAPRKGPLNKAPWFSEHVRRTLEKKFSAHGLYREGLTVRTTLDLRWEEWADEALRSGLENADRRLGFRGPKGFTDIKKGEWPDWAELNPERAGYEDQEEYYTSGRILSGVVLTAEKNRAVVTFKDMKGAITLKSMEWAHIFDPEKDARWAKKLKKTSEAFKPGDIIQVRILEGDPLPGEKPEEKLLPLEIYQTPDVQGALMSIDPKTGHVKAMIGGYDSELTKFNRAVQAYRQPGSSFKLIIYTAALTKGYTPASVLIDSPIIFNRAITEFKGWKPMNFEMKFYGPTTLRTAITHSRNIVTIKLLEKITPRFVAEFARNFGYSGELDANLSLALGSSTVTLEEMVFAYGALANQGTRMEPVYIKSIENREGEVIYKSDVVSHQAIPPAVAFQVADMMKNVVQNGTGRSLKPMLRGRPLAGKTGTTNDCVDAWFMGYTPDVVTGVWTGRDDPSTIGRRETGARMAIPIWRDFMKNVFAEMPINDFPPPPGVVFARINKETGLLTRSVGENVMFEVFMDGAQPTEYDSDAASLESATSDYKRGF
ncbi:MAG: PBP1A family penicillin-binding protein [Nitrospinota bacterium]|nr:PBP1A family penicillin-binding protein [Nitrospinota bacterium]